MYLCSPQSGISTSATSQGEIAGNGEITCQSPVLEPTKWCSGMVVAPKPGNKIRIYVDLAQLNKAMKQEGHPMATVDEILAKFQGNHIFTKLDANSGFWQIPLEESFILQLLSNHLVGIVSTGCHLV